MSRIERWSVDLIRFIDKWQKIMGAAFPLIDAVIAEAPISFVTILASPITLVGPS
jgi:hypothetical protein